ncbi:RadC family protein (plasmid) [Photobacterium damselae subsp. damselae]
MFTVEEKEVLKHAEKIIQSKIKKIDAFNNPTLVKKFCETKLVHEEREVFCVLFLDNQNRLIKDENIFYGTIDSASVYPREILKMALKVNAKSVILSHNHPSGIAEPSQSDKRITHKIQDALNLIDMRVLDHIVVGHGEIISFAEKGWI